MKKLERANTTKSNKTNADDDRRRASVTSKAAKTPIINKQSTLKSLKKSTSSEEDGILNGRSVQAFE